MHEHARRWGILGTGNAARNMAAAIRSAKGSTLQAVATRTAGRREEARSLGARRWHESYEALVASDDIDVVHIATPHTTHFQNALLCLEAGKHVVCEKPLTLSRLEAEHLILGARSKGLFLMEAVWPRFLPAVIRNRELLEQGSIGHAQFVNTSFAIHLDPASNPRVFDPSLGGGVINELGTYVLAFAIGTMGPVLSSKAVSTQDARVPEQCLMQCVHVNGLSSGFCSLTFQGRNQVITAGSDGQSTLLPAAGKFERLSIWRRSSGEEIVENYPYTGTGYEFMVEHVNDCMRKKWIESPLMPLAESLDMASVLESCNQQCASSV